MQFIVTTVNRVTPFLDFVEKHPYWLLFSSGALILLCGVVHAIRKRDADTMLVIPVSVSRTRGTLLMLAGTMFGLLTLYQVSSLSIAGLLSAHLLLGAFLFADKKLTWRIDEGCQNFLITGGIGSGKTNGINYLAWNLSSCQPSWGGLWLDNKGNSHEDLRVILGKHGRGDDIRVLDVRAGAKKLFYNVLADPVFTAEALGAAIAEVAADEGGKNSAFFKRQAALHCTECIKGLRCLGKPATFTTLYATLTDVDATSSFIAALLELSGPLKENEKRESKAISEAARIATHFQSKFISMPGDQFGGVVGTITNCLYPFITDAVADLTSNPTEPNGFTFDDLENAKVLCLSLPQVHLKERLALNALLKQLYYQYGMMRYDRPQRGEELPVLCLWLDEGHHSLRQGEAGDYMFLDRLRAARCAAFVGMQGADSPVPMLGADVTEATIKHLRSWFVFSPADAKAKKAVQEYIGKHEIQKTTRGFSGGRATVSRSPSDEYILKDKELTGLKNYRCHIFHVGSKRLTKFVRLPHCEPAKGFVPNIE
jgi:hypothetical protein